MKVRFIWKWITFLTILTSLGLCPASGQATRPSASDLTERQKDLLLQLSDAEANVQAINKVLRVTGYNVGIAYDQIDSNQKGKDIMNRQGGGPVRWDEFYGKTAKDFPRTGFWDDRLDDHRPQQFDFIYKANDDQIASARERISSLAEDQRSLLDRRHKHEEDQCRLWATLAWEDVKDREVEYRPLYRFTLKPEGPGASVLRPVILFLRTAESVANDGLDTIQLDQMATFTSGAKRMNIAYSSLQQSLADVQNETDFTSDQIKVSQKLKALCKDIAEDTKVSADDYVNAQDRDKAKEDNSKLQFRGQLQSSLTSFAQKLGELDDAVSRTAVAWNLGPDRHSPTTDVVPPLTAASQPLSKSVAVGVSQSDTDETGEVIGTMQGNTGRKHNGAIVLNDGERIHTNAAYIAPVIFNITAMTDGLDLRIAYAADQIIFNWKDDENQLRIDGGPASGRYKHGAGRIRENKWVDITLQVMPDSLTIFVDGAERYRTRADFSRVNEPLSIFPESGSVITVKSVIVHTGKDAVSRGGNNP